MTKASGILSEAGLWLAIAESCTGGLLGARLTDRPGASAFFRGGVVAYADWVKRKLLEVPEVVLREHGAVSAECARAMAEGVRRLFSVDLGVSVTGIAGPQGGSACKPVGLVYTALAAKQGPVWVREFRFCGDRAHIRTQAVDAALELLMEALSHNARSETRRARWQADS